jgi:hypothetical protein
MRSRSINSFVATLQALCVSALGCDPSPGPVAPRDVTDVERDATEESGTVFDTGSDVGPVGPFVGAWTVSTWTLTRAIGAYFPYPLDGGTDNTECARVVRDSYRVRTLRIDASTGAVSVNGQECIASVTAQTLTVNCRCGVPVAQVCSHTLTLRLDGAGARLAGDERFDFSYVTPAYCTAFTTFEAQLTRAP